jgi:hypothetical protein
MDARELRIQRVAENLRVLIYAINQGAGGSLLDTTMLRKAETALANYDVEEAANDDSYISPKDLRDLIHEVDNMLAPEMCQETLEKIGRALKAKVILEH